jgi:protein gp37
MTASKIEWTDRSDWNPIRGCTRVSPGCGGPGPHGGCYAEAMAARFSDPGQWGHGFAERTPKGGRWTGRVAIQPDRIDLPLRWRAPANIFASSTSDFFHEALSLEDIANLFGVMAVAATKFQGPSDGFDIRGSWTTSDGREVPLRWPRLRSGPHTFQVLTKRSGKMAAVLNSPRFRTLVARAAYRHARDRVDAGDRHDRIMSGEMWPLPNVWLGVSVEDQQRADERVPDLLATPAAVRWLSCEPLLGAVDLTRICKVPQRPGSIRAGIHIDALRGRYCESGMRYIGEWDINGPYPEGAPSLSLDWIVAGGESGPGARGSTAEVEAWMRSLRDQCAAAGVPFFGKQNYRKLPLPDDLLVREFPHAR